MHPHSDEDVFETPGDEDGVYDDPYSVVMYDIDASPDIDNLFRLLASVDHRWYAKRRLNALAAAGGLQALVADIIIDSLGRRWNPLLHPRDRFGRFIETGGFFRWLVKGLWNRAEVVRIDSDGTIYARSRGNDRIPDGQLLRFKNADSKKFISVAPDKASLSGDGDDLLADIPDFPEATDTQKRIYNALQYGDMPGPDLDIYRTEDDTSGGRDIGEQIAELSDRGLIEIYNDDNGRSRVRRPDTDDLDIVDFDEIDDVPEDVTPDLDDGPVLTRSQRDLYDQMVDLDEGEGDGIRPDEIPEASQEDLDALEDAGIIQRRDRDGPYHLFNPVDQGTSDDVDPDGDIDVDEDTEPDRDLGADIDAAAQDRFGNDADQREIFISRAEELAGLAEETDDADYDRRENRARRAAEQWFAEYNADETGGPDTPEATDTPEAEDLPDASAPEPVRDRPENMDMARELVQIYFPEDLEDDLLEEEQRDRLYRGVAGLFYAADLEDNGETKRADLNRRRALNALDDAGVPENERDGWIEAVRAWRDDENLPDVPESEVDEIVDDFDDADLPEDVPEGDLPEAESAPDVPEDVPETPDTDAPEAENPWDDYARRLEEEGPAANFADRLDQENRLAEEFGVDPNDEDAPWTWNNLVSEVGEERARELFLQHNGELGRAMANFDGSGDNAPDRDVPEPGTPEADAPEADAPEDDPIGATRRQWLDWEERVNARRGTDDTLDSEIESEELVAEDMGLDLDEAQGVLTWKALRNGAGQEVAEELYEKHNGNVDDALRDLLQNPNEFMSRVQANRDLANAPDVPDRESSVDVPEGDAPDADVSEIGAETEEALQRAADAPDVDLDEGAPEIVDIQPQESDLVSSDDNEDFQRLIDNPSLLDDKPDVSREGVAFDRSGNRIEIGGWYKANRGGEGDPDQVVGILDQEKYPGRVLIQAPDGKMKIVLASGDNPLEGLNRMPDPGTEAREKIRVQRAAGGGELLDLDQNDPKNVMSNGEFAQVGMRVSGARDVGRFQTDDEGVIVRIGWSGNRPNIYVRKVNDPDGPEIAMAPRYLVQLEGTPTPTPPPTPDPDPDIPEDGAPNIRPGVWGLPQDGEEVANLLEELGEVDYVDFLNGFANPGAAFDRIQDGINNRDVEIVPGEGEFGRARIRAVPRGNATPDLPEGAEDAVEGDVLNVLDNIGEGGRGDLFDIDDPDLGAKLDALQGLVERGVVETFDLNGQRRFRRVAPEPETPEAENEFEANILRIIDDLDRPAARGDLLDLDADDLDERMAAINSLVDRGIIRQSVDPETGRPVFRRPTGNTSTPTVMTDEEAVDALRNGADPMLIANSKLDDALKAAGLRRVPNGDRGISPNDWVMGADSGPFQVKIKGAGPQENRVYMVKRSGGLENDVLNEVIAGAISGDLLERIGRDDDNGPLFHPRVGVAEAPRGLGSRAGGAIIMDHAAYGYPEGYEFREGASLSDSDINRGGGGRDVIKLGLYDYIINNTVDRHQKNQFFARDPETGQIRVVVIDNGFAFGAGEIGRVSSFSEFARALRPKMLLRRADLSDQDQVRDAVQNFVDNYSQLDVESAMTRIRNAYPNITPDQEQYAREWLQTAVDRVEEIAGDIDGVVSTIMGV